MGHPIWTHHFASQTIRDEIQKTILEQCPGMPTDIEGVTKDNWREHAARLEAEFGPTVKIRRGGGTTAMGPMDGLPDHLKDNAIVIKS